MVSGLKAIWDHEYLSAQAIPSSFREAPSQALLLFKELLSFSSLNSALDVGCGNGRNSIYLAQLGLQVEAMDFLAAALDHAAKRTAKAGFTRSINLQERNLEEIFPFEPASFDLCLDFYVYCHFLDAEMKRHYVSELFRVTKPNGYVITTLFSPKDEYYSRLIKTGEEPTIVKDPANGIVKELYSEEKFRRAFAPPFQERYFVGFEFCDIVQGKSYRRHIMAMALQK